MKKVLFGMQTLVCGGVEKELLTILKMFDRQKYDLTVLLLYEQDLEIQRQIPADVKVINLNIDAKYYCVGFLDAVKERFRRGNCLEALRLIGMKALNKGTVPSNMDFSAIPELKSAYDYAVCYHIHSPVMLRYIAEKVSAKHKIAWIHNDFSTTGYKIGKYDLYLKKYDKFATASTKLCEEFVERLAQYKDKVHPVFNVIDQNEVIEKSQNVENIEQEYLQNKRFKILTVGRFVEQKGFDLAVQAAKILSDLGQKFTWYVIGYGVEEDSIKHMISEYGLNDEFVILGRRDNPYAYMKMADLYVQPSRHEGFSITVLEARTLKKIVVCTNFAGAADQIQDGLNGVIVPEITPQSIASGVLRMMQDQKLRRTITENIENCDISDSWKLIEGMFQE